MKRTRFLIPLLALLCLLCALCLAACDEEPAPTPGGNDTPAHTHSFGAWSVTRAATCVAKGEETRSCACGASEKRDVAMNPTAHNPATAWTYDGTNHWHDCTACGYDINLIAHTYDAENTCVCQHYKDARVKFTLKNGTYAVTDYTGTATEVIIPSKYKGIAVTAIGDYAFYYCDSLQSVTFGENSQLTTIGDDAFYICSNLQSITIPASVTSIGDDAFYKCSGLESITVESGNTAYHSAGNCLIETASKTLIRGCKNSVIPTDGSVTTIGDKAFYNCDSLQTITIPAGVTTIGDEAFSSCSGLQTVTFGENSQLTTIGDDAFSYCRSLQSITIPASVTTIGSSAFYGCSKLTSVIFENPNGWWLAFSSSATSGTAISATNLAKTDTAATYLKSTYDDYYWKRG